MAWRLASPGQVIQERTKQNLHCLLYLVSQFTHHHFCHFLFIRNESPGPAPAQGEGHMLPLFEGKIVKEFVDIFKDTM